MGWFTRKRNTVEQDAQLQEIADDVKVIRQDQKYLKRQVRGRLQEVEDRLAYLESSAKVLSRPEE